MWLRCGSPYQIRMGIATSSPEDPALGFNKKTCDMIGEKHTLTLGVRLIDMGCIGVYAEEGPYLMLFWYQSQGQTFVALSWQASAWLKRLLQHKIRVKEFG